MAKTDFNILPILLILLAISVCNSCTKYLVPETNYGELPIPKAPDYADPNTWAALPDRKDLADRTPESYLKDEQATAAVDVFFLHPTTYVGRKGEDNWNGPVYNEKVNKKTDESAILFQASVFNGAGKVYAPRYRQAHYHAYFSKNKSDANQAFDLAYQDVKAAFEFYLENYNNGRPIIIAGHSQGTNHSEKLLKEYFEGKPLQEKLVAAYLVGMPIRPSSFKSIKVCETPEETGCFCSWRSYEKGYYPRKHQAQNNFAVTNPLNWGTDSTYVSKEMNEGTVLRKFKKGLKVGITDARVHQGLLWITKPKFFGSMFIRFKNYHIADYNLFYANIRKNAQLRTKAYLDAHKKSSK